MLQRVWLVCWMLVLGFCVVVVGYVGDCGADVNQGNDCLLL